MTNEAAGGDSAAAAPRRPPPARLADLSLVMRWRARLGRPREMVLGRLGYRCKLPFYKLFFYRLLLGGKPPGDVRLAPPDPWPGQAQHGAAVVQNRFTLAGRTVENPAPFWQPLGVEPAWLEALHGFLWLRDLRVAGGDAARRRARDLTASWIDSHSSVRLPAWEPATTGRRLANWIGQYEFFAASADMEFKDRLLDSAARQARHLTRVLPAGLGGSELVAAIKGLVYAGACLPGGEAWLERGLALLDETLPRQVLADGGHLERSPAVHLQVLRDLIDLRATLAAAEIEAPRSLQLAIEGMAPFLKMLQHADGSLALFNDTREEDTVVVDLALNRCNGRVRALASAPQSGFQRLQAGRSIIIVDSGAPPAPGYDTHAHAGTLSFEMSHGRDRLIVNCGAHAGHPDWRRVQRASAAHSTLTLAETNSSELLAEGLGRRPQAVVCRREETDGAVWLDMSHDGYQPIFEAVHHRRLFLAAGGEDLRGEDLVEGPEGLRFTIRFHLHPQVRVSLVQHGAAALLRLSGGQGWRLRCAGAAMAMEDTVYLAARDGVRRGNQIVLTGTTRQSRTSVKWALQREGGKRGPG